MRPRASSGRFFFAHKIRGMSHRNGKLASFGPVRLVLIRIFGNCLLDPAPYRPLKSTLKNVTCYLLMSCNLERPLQNGPNLLTKFLYFLEKRVDILPISFYLRRLQGRIGKGGN